MIFLQTFPILYALINGTSTIAYEKIFQFLRKSVPEFKPSTMYCEHEVNLIFAAQDAFGDINNFVIINCHFHYNQVNSYKFNKNFLKYFFSNVLSKV